MPENQLIKSKSRVLQHGEVFTPLETVKQMLDEPKLKEALYDISTTFLEPSAGEGAFLVEILTRKMRVAKELAESRLDFDDKSLIALSSLYGVELLEDNVETLVMNMIMTFSQGYSETLVEKFDEKANDAKSKHVLESAKTIIRANMLQGNTLTRKDADGNPLYFSEWKLLPVKRGVQKVQRKTYTFDAIINQSEEESSVVETEPVFEEIDLLADVDFEDESSKTDTAKTVRYVPCRLTEVYQELVEDVAE
ncbi:DNA methylase subunit (HsdM) [Fructobacillus fructosus]|uniref:DNA methylase subunit (HsdM) n=1 Tax=Fructobacillus fructosus TaxID=1631 RepID=A0ABN9YYC9_9LACO|nr:DNA methylase subunit (HsdM) [Fructobacillus fructosus]CAK1252917.1 DNA methylase subunit (HsdM) [Fructobacillus fructosus]